MTPKEIRMKVLAHVAKERGGEWPDDEWLRLSDDWDVNIWFDDTEQEPRISLYPVSSGVTMTNYQPIWIM